MKAASFRHDSGQWRDNRWAPEVPFRSRDRHATGRAAPRGTFPMAFSDQAEAVVRRAFGADWVAFTAVLATA